MWAAVSHPKGEIVWHPLLGHAAEHQQLRKIEVAKVHKWRQGFQHPNELVKKE
jgi:hypothetical protein